MFIDTSVLIDILLHKSGSMDFQNVFQIVKDKPLFISVLQIGEYSDWCYKRDLDPSDALPSIKKLVNIINLTEEICIEGSRIKREQRMKGSRKFSLADGIIVATARSINAPILSKDNDFQYLEDAIVLDNFK